MRVDPFAGVRDSIDDPTALTGAYPMGARVELCHGACAMPRGSKASYSSKQKRQASHIEESYEKRGVSKKTAEARAWATVNKSTGGARKKKASRSGPRTRKAAKK